MKSDPISFEKGTSMCNKYFFELDLLKFLYIFQGIECLIGCCLKSDDWK